jgi:septal ring factor EnvC (AmiA/AmiB activator)
MKREQVQNHLTEITAGIPKEHRGKVEALAWKLFHFAEDSGRGRDEAVAAYRALEEMMTERQEQITASERKIEQLDSQLVNANKEREATQKALRDSDLKNKQLETDLEKAKREMQIIRDKMDEWWRALNRAELLAENVEGFGGVHQGKGRSIPAPPT